VKYRFFFHSVIHGDLCNNNCVLISAVPSHDGKGVDVEMCIVIMPTDGTTG
jgi:hypothetical protein